MFDEPEDKPTDGHLAPSDRAKEKSDEFRMHAELAAVFEAVRKFDAQIRPNLDPDIARDVQRTIGRLEKAKVDDGPLISADAQADAARVLNLPAEKELPTNDYHIYRRPGEVMIARWLAGDEVDLFYERLQAHFDAAMDHFREEERQSKQWKQDPHTLAYLAALDALKVNMSERYLRAIIRQHKTFVLSTQAADEMDILHLCEFIMGVPAGEVVGAASAPPEAPTEQDRAWFFKLFSLRGIDEGREVMCFFTYLQKTDDWA